MPSTVRWFLIAVAPLVLLSPSWNGGHQPMNGWGAIIAAALLVVCAVAFVRERWSSESAGQDLAPADQARVAQDL